MIKVTHIITGLNRGGAERTLYSVLTNGLQDKFDNRVISLLDSGAYGPKLAATGISVTALNINRDVKSLFRLANDFKLHPPDILQGWMYHGNLVATFANNFLPYQPILSWNIRCAPGRNKDRSISTRSVICVLRSMSGRPNSIIYNSAKSLFEHQEEGFCASKATLIPNGFNLLEWKRGIKTKYASRQALKLPIDKTIIGYIGRNHPQKDLRTLFLAISILKSFSEAPHFVMVGKDLKTAAPSDLDSQDFTFLGERADVAEILPTFDFLCLSSKSEGFPNVLGEAMACGVPCITTDAGDAADIVADTGWVVPREDPVALAAAIRSALSISPQEFAQRSAAARSRVEAQFSIKAAVDNYSKLYETLLSERLQCAG
ncbi:glycosyltransferase [Cypionkella sp.]|uniref:glycosyltransferase n=1 Tax=Cypionkella sp. TaxID=2811411 RepID=UPI002FDEA2E1